METATENLPDLWTALIGLGKTQPNKKDRSRHAETTYASVAATAATHESNPPTTRKQSPRNPQGRPIKTDKRVLIRMSSDRAAEHSNYSVKKHIVDTLQLKPTQILDARKIRTGWSVYPDTTETQQFILSEQQKWLPALNATQAYKQETWYTFIVEDCPRHLRSITGDHMALMDAAYDEIVTATGQAPVNFHIRNKDDNTTPNAVLIVSFNIDKQADGSFSALAERQD
ncbi:hypothetical protein LEL_10950 [Akanthomyces lecanii RCEF 1005]|uniref:Uncharacterized protein n=1 Tax=Akanthomyces lecanii RCEF 1005 TaxID=1081108 RepID=A0A167PJX0_CORDF|nr:hypothetical protein LEL_10950 [Akanthomyces lecanii RCEF 1005]